MSFLKPSAMLHFLAAGCASLQWIIPCQSLGFLRWPGLDGILRWMVIALLWSTFSEMLYIPSSSMYPTLRVGDRIIVEKASYYIRNPSRNEIITFRDPTQSPNSSKANIFIKRVVAKAGDSVQVKHGLLFVNGIPQNEDFIADHPRYTSPLTHIPKDHLYVLGDNRNNSYDSHVWGPLPMKNIVGRFITCCYRPSDHRRL